MVWTRTFRQLIPEFSREPESLYQYDSPVLIKTVIVLIRNETSRKKAVVTRIFFVIVIHFTVIKLRLKKLT